MMPIPVRIAVVAALVVAAPAAAQNTVWSGTMTAGLYESPDGSFVGYHPGIEVGSMTDPDFEFRGVDYTVAAVTQPTGGDSSGAIHFRISPAVAIEYLETMTVVSDGEALPVSSYDNTSNSSFIRHSDPGWRWEDGQEVALELTSSTTPVPALPLAAGVLLALALGVVGAGRKATR